MVRTCTVVCAQARVRLTAARWLETEAPSLGTSLGWHMGVGKPALVAALTTLRKGQLKPFIVSQRAKTLHVHDCIITRGI